MVITPEERERKEVGWRVRHARESAGIGQAELGRELGYPHAAPYWRKEEGQRGFTDAQLKQVAARCKVSFDWLRFGKGEPPARVLQMMPALKPPLTRKPKKPRNDNAATVAMPIGLAEFLAGATCGPVSADEVAFLRHHAAMLGGERRTAMQFEYLLLSERCMVANARGDEELANQYQRMLSANLSRQRVAAGATKPLHASEPPPPPAVTPISAGRRRPPKKRR